MRINACASTGAVLPLLLASLPPHPPCCYHTPSAGFERSIRDIVSVVHIGEHTLSKRLYEFSHTSASTFTAGGWVGVAWAGDVRCACLASVPVPAGGITGHRRAVLPCTGPALLLLLTCLAPTHPSSFISDEFEERAKQIEHEETQRLESAPPTDAPAGLLESAGCEHLRECGLQWGLGG